MQKEKKEWVDELAYWIGTQHGTAGWETKLKNFIRSQREQARREGVENAIKLLRQHPAGEGGYCDTGEDMEWSCRSQCTRFAVQRIKSKLL